MWNVEGVTYGSEYKTYTYIGPTQSVKITYIGLFGSLGLRFRVQGFGMSGGPLQSWRIELVDGCG